MQSSLETFARYIAKRRKYYELTRTDGTVIPELFKQFQREDVQGGYVPPDTIAGSR
jgi:hypothetical protein